MLQLAMWQAGLFLDDASVRVHAQWYSATTCLRIFEDTCDAQGRACAFTLELGFAAAVCVRRVASRTAQHVY